MSSNLIDTLEFPSALPLRKFMIATKDEKSDLGFVYTDVLSYLLKKKFSLVIVTCAQPFNHYYHMLARTGLILKSLLSTNRAVVIDMLQSVEQLVEQSKVTDDHLLSCLVNKSSSGLQCLYASVEKAVQSVSTSSAECPGFIVFVDEINPLLNLGIHVKELHKFIHYCRVLCSTSSSLSGFLFIGGQQEPDDLEINNYLNYLGHLSDMRLHVQGLATGYSKDIHGKLLVTVKDDNLSDSNTKQVLFRVAEKGAKLFPLGL